MKVSLSRAHRVQWLREEVVEFGKPMLEAMTLGALLEHVKTNFFVDAEPEELSTSWSEDGYCTATWTRSAL
jgi:hypothetical protein